MGRTLYMNQRAEDEANDVGLRFMNSRDVLGDMSKEYGVNLKSMMHIHTDDEMGSHTHALGRDAVASGNDVFFGKGILESNTQESRGLLAHEAAHTMQQAGVGGMTQSVAAGSYQGGIGSFFRKVGGFFGGLIAGNRKKDKTQKGVGKPDDLIFNNPTDDVSGLDDASGRTDMGALEKALYVPRLVPQGAVYDKNAKDRAADEDWADGRAAGATMRNRFLTSTILGSTAAAIANKDARFLKRSWLYRGLHGIFSMGKSIFDIGRAAVMAPVYGVSKLAAKISGKKDNAVSKWTGNQLKRSGRSLMRNLPEGLLTTAGILAGPLGGMLGGAIGGAAGGALGAISSTVTGAVGGSVAGAVGGTAGSILGTAMTTAAGVGGAHVLNGMTRGTLEHLSSKGDKEDYQERAKQEYNDSYPDDDSEDFADGEDLYKRELHDEEVNKKLLGVDSSMEEDEEEDELNTGFISHRPRHRHA